MAGYWPKGIAVNPVFTVEKVEFKNGYTNNPLWSEISSDTHLPCGYWYSGEAPPGIPEIEYWGQYDPPFNDALIVDDKAWFVSSNAMNPDKLAIYGVDLLSTSKELVLVQSIPFQGRRNGEWYGFAHSSAYGVTVLATLWFPDMLLFFVIVNGKVSVIPQKQVLDAEPQGVQFGSIAVSGPTSWCCVLKILHASGQSFMKAYRTANIGAIITDTYVGTSTGDANCGIVLVNGEYRIWNKGSIGIYVYAGPDSWYACDCVSGDYGEDRGNVEFFNGWYRYGVFVYTGAHCNELQLYKFYSYTKLYVASFYDSSDITSYHLRTFGNKLYLMIGKWSYTFQGEYYVLYVSDDGVTWNERGTIYPNQYSMMGYPIELTMHETNEDILVFTAYNAKQVFNHSSSREVHVKVFYISLNGGWTWRQATTPFYFRYTEVVQYPPPMFQIGRDINPVFPFEEQENKTSDVTRGYWKKNT